MFVFLLVTMFVPYSCEPIRLSQAENAQRLFLRQHFHTFFSSFSSFVFSILANAERAKAVCPLCVGIGATSATLALLVPVLLDSLGFAANMQLMTQIYLFCPIVAILAAAVASLALQETRSYCNQAIGIGNRRFAKSGIVGRTWLSSSEIVSRKSSGATEKWKSFSFSILPAPLLGTLVPGALPTKVSVKPNIAKLRDEWISAHRFRFVPRRLSWQRLLRLNLPSFWHKQKMN
jgi:hypothetical protein